MIDLINRTYLYLSSYNGYETWYIWIKEERNRNESKTFLLDGHIPISNNICERTIKPFAI